MCFISLEFKSQFQLNGDASTIDCKCYQLTPDMGNKAGSVWNVNLIDLNQPFDMGFTVNLGCNNSTWGGADGMVFALQPLNTSIGSSGGQMGLGGVAPSLGVYIDTYQNTAHGDLYNDHISINLNGDVIHSSPNNIAGPYDLGEIENCTAEPLRISWDPSTNIMNVYYNNILVLTYTGNIINNVFNGNSMVYWGFTASTGGASNFHQFCIDVPDLTIDTSNLTIESEKCEQQNGSITGLNIVGGIAPISWSWNNSASSNLDTLNLSYGTYNLQLTDGMGCVSNNQIVVEEFAAPQIDTSNIFIKNEDCGQGNGSILNLSVITFSDSIEFYWNNLIQDSINVDSLSAGNYQLIVSDMYNCSDTMNFLIIDTNSHNITIFYDSLFYKNGDTVTFHQNSIDSSSLNLWTFGDASTSTDYEPYHIYNDPGTFTICLSAANSFGCHDTTCVEIVIQSSEIIVPNIFSPNGDGLNDELFIYGIDNNYELKIFNRWGSVVYKEYPYLNGWNGYNQYGKRLPEGQYYFMLRNVAIDVKLNGEIMVVY
ncbi:MAG: gliding motility-associated C-terminal domain-containing protein [Flavobacteriales bacterium]|nr:gliding motility-associated C-terminal domain-containing protein [Flavobacteriales bacterium]